MRPTALELLHGVRSLLATEILPEMTAPHLRSQVMLAVAMLSAAAAELDGAPVVYAEERARLAALADEALPVVRRVAPESPLVADLDALAASAVLAPDRMSRLAEESAQLLVVLDRLSAFCDEQRELGDPAIAALAARVDGELRAWTGARMAWIGGGP
jgi:hypothetical protein